MSWFKRAIIFSSLIAIIFLLGRIRINETQNVNGYIIENYLHQSKREVDVAEILNKDVEGFKLLIDTNKLKAISREYDGKTEDIEWNSYKAKLIFKGDTFKVSVSGHADTPSCHKKGNRISLRFKIKGKKRINGVKKFSLVLFDPIGNRSKALELFAGVLDVKMKPSHLVSLVVNENKVWPMHFEPSTKHYTRVNGLLYRKVNLYKSAIQCYTNSKLAIDSIFASDSSSIHASFRELAKGEEYSFNKEESSHLAKHMAVQLVLDLNGHGLTGENFVFVFDKRKGEFRPVLTRDDIPGVCDTSGVSLTEHYKFQVRKYIKEHGDEILFSSLIKSQSFVDSVRVHVNSLISMRTPILEEFMEYNKITESLFSGKFLDVHFNWRDHCEMDERIFLPNVSPCMINNNLDFWSKKVNEYDFWNVLKF
ncbi:hypothetical protein N9Q76_00105 [Flavobacteriales bacterium]|nr:hypothetical protein [Flavobacteriales bacterium]